MNLWRFVQRCVAVLLVALQSVTWTSMATALAMANIVVATVGCAATPVAQRYPQARVEKVCVRPPGIEPDAAHWVYADSGAVVSSEHPEVFDRIARETRSIYEHDQDAEPTSAQRLPYPHNDLVCPERFQPLPQKVDQGWLPGETLFFADESLRWRAAEAQHWDRRRTAALLGNLPPPTAPKRYVTGGNMAPGPLSAHEQAIRAARGHCEDIGQKYGAAYGELHKTMTLLPPMGPGIGLEHFLKTHPDFVLELLSGLNKKLEAIPDLPTYDDADLANAALQGFQRGFGHEMAQAQTESLALFGFFEVVHTVVTAGAALMEAPTVKAFEATFARLRRIPIFVPGTTSGPGFFLRIPKPPPANANAPSLPIGVAPPPAGTPPPFGNLSRAAEFGIQTESSLAKAIAKTGLEKHHLIEQRFDRIMGADPRMKLTVAVTEAEHQFFTNAWRQRIGYGKPLPPKDVILQYAAEIYAPYPAILKALGL